MALRSDFCAGERASAAASALVVASGFSHRTCLPASSAADAMAKCCSVRRADVHRVDVRVFEDGPVVALRPLNAQGAGECSGLVQAAAGDGGDVHEAQAAHRLEMNPAHETGSDNRRAHSVVAMTSFREYHPVLVSPISDQWPTFRQSLLLSH